MANANCYALYSKVKKSDILDIYIWIAKTLADFITSYAQ